MMGSRADGRDLHHVVELVACESWKVSILVMLLVMVRKVMITAIGE